MISLCVKILLSLLSFNAMAKASSFFSFNRTLTLYYANLVGTLPPDPSIGITSDEKFAEFWKNKVPKLNTRQLAALGTTNKDVCKHAKKEHIEAAPTLRLLILVNKECRKALEESGNLPHSDDLEIGKKKIVVKVSKDPKYWCPQATEYLETFNVTDGKQILKTIKCDKASLSKSASAAGATFDHRLTIIIPLLLGLVVILF